MKVKNDTRPHVTEMEGYFEGDTEIQKKMLNLLKFKKKAEYEDGRETDLTGKEAYSIYGREVTKHLAKIGGKLVFGGKISRLMIGEVEDLWDSVAIAQYPSRKAMLEMLMDSDYQKIEVHRAAGLEGQLNIEIKEGDL